MWDVKQLHLLIALVMGQSVLGADKKLLIADPIFEEAICKSLKKSGGELGEGEVA